jgi:hypothetical protein
MHIVIERFDGTYAELSVTPPESLGERRKVRFTIPPLEHGDRFTYTGTTYEVVRFDYDFDTAFAETPPGEVFTSMVRSVPERKVMVVREVGRPLYTTTREVSDSRWRVVDDEE